MTEHKIRCAVVGYGPVFNWGRMHTRWMKAVPEMEVIAICDKDPECAAKAKQDFPEVDIHTDLEEVLLRPDLDLVAIFGGTNLHIFNNTTVDRLDEEDSAEEDTPAAEEPAG